MDIYIGGVRDRNAALHGDVVMVEINTHDQWKVLYEQLDEYLGKHPHEMNIVYRPLEPSIPASVSSIASPYNHMSNKTNYKQALQVKEKIECTNIEKIENLGHLKQCDSDVIIEDDDLVNKEKCEASTDKVKRKKKIKGRKRVQSKLDGIEECKKIPLEPSASSVAAAECGSDSLVLLTPNLLKVQGSGPPLDSDDDLKGFAVPPDQLSECDFTDDESGCSEILDYEQAREDEAFIKAQWEAFQEQQRKEKEGQDGSAGGSSVKKELLAVTDGADKLDIKSENVDKVDKLIGGIDKLDIKSNCNSNLEMGKKEPSANYVHSVMKDDQDIGMGGASKVENKCHNTESLQGAKKKQRYKRKKKLHHSEIKEEPMDQEPECDQVKSVMDADSPCNKGKKAAVCEQLQKSFNKFNEGGCVAEDNFGKGSLPNNMMMNSMKTPDSSNVSTSVCSQDVGSEKIDSQRDRNSVSRPSDRYESSPKTPQDTKPFYRYTPGGGMAKKRENNRETEQRTTPSVLQVQRLPIGEKFIQKTAHVVYIVTKKHSRIAAGALKLFGDKNPHLALFSPSDYRVPRLKIPMKQCPPDFMARHQDYLSRIFLAKIVEWNEPKFAFGELVRDIGLVGDIEAETEALLLENGVDYSEFPEAVTKDLPTVPWSIPPQEIKNRKDLRDQCIFTIDPSTARDLDDAMSCQPLPSGNFRVGVHIADVSYFIAEETPLDRMASERATSVYLTQKVIPMLPRVLCEHLCSLNPGEDRLAFSVIWELAPNGKVIGEWFGRTVIRSCVKLSYDHAQSMIENPNKEWSKDEIPEITGGYSTRHISAVVNNLQSIAKHLRKKRFDDGALRLDQVKIAFHLNHETGMPSGFFEYVIKDSNRLIEEFMLLANMAVAHKIYQGYPEFAILRRHPPPLEKPMENLGNLLETLNIHLDMSSAGALQRSLQVYIGDDKYSESRLQVIVSLCSKPMQNAKYFCAGATENEPFSHYALNVPLYTHFTSPIRRYADVMVHRILAAIVDPGKGQPSIRTQLELQRITERCNDRKQTSKVVQEVSGELYLCLFIKQIKEMDEEAMVTMVLDHAFDVLILRMGVIKRVYLDKLPLVIFNLKKQDARKSLSLTWKADGDRPIQIQEISLFTLVTVTLKAFDGNALKFNAVLCRPS